MTLFLSGGGSGSQTAQAVNRFGSALSGDKPLLYIPLAMEPERYNGCLDWITDELSSLSRSIYMVRSADELAALDLEDYAGIYIGGGNTFKLLRDLKQSGAFGQIGCYLQTGGVIFGGSAGAIIFGENLNACALDDPNDAGLTDINGFDLLGGVSLLCHYTNRTPEKDGESRRYLLSLSKQQKVIALPEEDTIVIQDGRIEVMGTRPWYYFEGGLVREHPVPTQIKGVFL